MSQSVHFKHAAYISIKKNKTLNFLFDQISSKVNVEPNMQTWILNNTAPKKWQLTELELVNNQQYIYQSSITHDTEIILVPQEAQKALEDYCNTKQNKYKVRVNIENVNTFKGSFRFYMHGSELLKDIKHTILRLLGITEANPLFRTGAIVDAFEISNVLDEDVKVVDILYVFMRSFLFLFVS